MLSQYDTLSTKILYRLTLEYFQMKAGIGILLFSSIFLTSTVFATDPSSNSKNEMAFTDEELIIAYTISILVVIGIILFLTRDIILKRKSDYDSGDYESKKDKDYEKYHSDWLDDTVGFHPSGKKLNDDEFRKAAQKSSLPNYYETLGVSIDAKPEEIRKKFRLLAKEWHPDKKHDDESEKKWLK